MAKAFDDAALWLSPKLDYQNADPDAVFAFPSEFPYEFGVSSPVESVAGSTETESSDDEEDFFAGLTRRLSQTTLHDSRKHQLTATDKYEVQKTRVLAGSPQSTLSGIGSWSGRSVVSGDGTTNSSSRVPSPSTTPFSDQNDPWEVIFAAAGQVARLKMNSNVSPFDLNRNRNLPNLPRATARNPNPNPNQNTIPNSFSNLTSQQMMQDQVVKQMCATVWGMQEAKAYWLAQQQQHMQNRGREVGYESVKCGNNQQHLSSLPQSAWPPLQIQNQNQQLQFSGSVSRVSGPGRSAPPKRGCGGTGVFLPRQYGNHNHNHPSEPRKKTGCAPVVVPAKVVHALNLNFEDLNSNFQPRPSNAFATDYDALLARRNALLMQQRLLSARREEAAGNYEARLPQEWTY